MAHREPLLALLGRYRPIDGDDAAKARELEAFVRRTPACFERSNPEGHVTGSAWVVDPSGDRVLLTHHRKLGLWLQLGGHADGDGDILAVALREACEESGIDRLEPITREIFDVDVHPIPARPDEPAHLHFDVRFALRATGSTVFRVSRESRALEWVEIENLEIRTQEASMMRMRRKWLLDGRKKYFEEK